MVLLMLLLLLLVPGTAYVLGRYSQLPHLVGTNKLTIGSTEEAEGLAIKVGLKCAVEEGVQCLLVFPDSLLWTNALNEQSDDLSWELHSLLLDIKYLCRSLTFCVFVNVPRAYVTCAHMLATELIEVAFVVLFPLSISDSDPTCWEHFPRIPLFTPMIFFLTLDAKF
ncbi:hypothetical protein FRX31_024019 [Thalictrum thalictroides]|uniref:RNase H type-1 domain-containing protein n=1 Tax=Thalictrum thalictroides TaxID=46969 RepID=A0A7J6VMR8_THATH|nr:hypothetical protein FRX31_024019 [Thalictrum thalictroides]